MTVLSNRFATLAAAFRTWSDRFVRGVVVALCVVLTIFLAGQLIPVVGQIPGFAGVTCFIINGALSSRYVPADLKARERGIRYKTGCTE
jgi:hypothetical protein